MSCTALAQMLSITLYQKRFFPYYSFCVLGGVDQEGRGAVYCYDAIGSYEREKCRANGSAAALIQPFLDNQVIVFEQVCLDVMYIYVINRFQKRTCKMYHRMIWN